jgi:hypothetical protein
MIDRILKRGIPVLALAAVLIAGWAIVGQARQDQDRPYMQGMMDHMQGMMGQGNQMMDHMDMMMGNLCPGARGMMNMRGMMTQMSSVSQMMQGMMGNMNSLMGDRMFQGDTMMMRNLEEMRGHIESMMGSMQSAMSNMEAMTKRLGEKQQKTVK